LAVAWGSVWHACFTCGASIVWAVAGRVVAEATLSVSGIR
jgi:hypothetical protein